MLNSQNVMAFVATSNPDRAKAFYGDTLGLRLVADEPWALVFDANGTMLRVQKVQELTAAPYTVLGWRVSNLAEPLRALSAKGVALERFGFLEQDKEGVWQAPNGDRVAWFKDPDGNVLSLAEIVAG